MTHPDTVIKKPMRVLLWPHPTLKQASAEVTRENLPKPEFFREMLAVMRAAGGVGLSAIQVGVPLRIFVLSTKESGGDEVLVNPHLIQRVGQPKWMMEGCLSTPGQFAEVKRYSTVEVWYQTPEMVGTYIEHPLKPGVPIMASCYISWATGTRAQAVQHELEHLDGMMYTDHLTSGDRSRILGNMLKLKRSGRR